MSAPGPSLRTETVTPLPASLAVGGGSALFLDGRCHLDGAELERLEVSFDGASRPVLGFGLAPPRMRGEDYWWAIVPVPASGGRRPAQVSLRATARSGEVAEAELGSVLLEPLTERAAASPARPEGGPGPLVAICMATYEPDPAMLEVQVESIRAQSHRNWICLVSDDGSSRRSREVIERVIGGDPRFELSQAPANRGFYANFERALRMVPPEADLVALSDQDDRWRPEKLGRLIAAREPGAGLVFSDMRVVTPSGREVAPSYWAYRPVNHTDFGSLLIANTVTGAASLFDARLLDDILPFPPRLGGAYHDHWIAQVAMALGPISYLDEPLHDYVQHDEAALGFWSANGQGRFSSPPLERARSAYERWRDRGHRLGWRVPYFRLYCRVRLATTALRLRLGDRMPADRVAALERIEDSPSGIAWLARRGLRDLRGPTATIGRERVMLAGLAWKRGAVARREARRLRRRLLARGGGGRAEV